MSNSKLTVALHLLALVSTNCSQSSDVFCSEDAAKSANTNPVVVRRILGQLRNAGIVESQNGRGGGWKLARDPKRISIADVYRALADDQPMFGVHAHAPSKSCAVGKNIAELLVSGPYAKAEQAMEKEFERVSIADITAALMAGHRKQPRKILAASIKK